MNFSSEYEIDGEHEVDSTPTNDEESALLVISANNPLTKGNNGKLITGTATEATIGLGGPREEASE